MAEFTPIPRWPGYEVSSSGRVWSVESNWRGYGRRELQQTINSYGYPSVRLSLGDGRRKRIVVHRLVVETFVGERPEGCDQIRHLNGDKTDNRVSNLAWGNAASNAADRTAHGRAALITPEKRAAMSAGHKRYWEERKSA